MRLNNKFHLFLMLFLFGLFSAQAWAATQPLQPESGPGSNHYSYDEVKKVSYGDGATSYFIFEPASPEPQEPLPVIIFMHGWNGINPKSYGAWIEHLVRRGNIVIYPAYQENARTPVKEFAPNMVAALKDAFAELQSGAHARPDLNRVATVGHSMGGLVAPTYAALAAENGLPVPKAVMSIEAGKTWMRAKRASYPLSDLSKIPAGTALVAMYGEEDRLCKDVDAKNIYQQSTSIHPSDKILVKLVTDSHGSPAMKSSHLAPCAPDEAYNLKESSRPERRKREGGGRLRSLVKERIKARVTGSDDDSELSELSMIDNEGGRRAGTTVDAMDFYGTWKTWDMICDTAFSGKTSMKDLSNNPDFTSMGKWSDGTVAAPLEIIV